MKRTKMKAGALTVAMLFLCITIASTEGQIWRSIMIDNNPPYTPSNPHPPDGATDVIPYGLNLSFTDGDPDGDPVMFDFSFGVSNPPHLIVRNITEISIPSRPPLAYNTTYYWKIVSWDIHSASAEGPIWNFTTINNSPPNAPNNPHPPNETTDVPLNTSLAWNCSDPYHDVLIYDVYLGTSTPLGKVASNQTENTYSPDTTLDSLTTYFWKIVAWDPYGLSNTSEIWVFTTRENSPPYQPSNPSPPNGSMNTSPLIISWTGGDPDGDPTTYDIYIGIINPPPLFISGYLFTYFSLMDLPPDTTYYWRIGARDNHNASTRGPVWWFRTSKGSDLSCEGDLSWTHIKPGATVTGSFTVENIGQPSSFLNWEITDQPNWGNWSFDPPQGDHLTPENGPVTVNVTVVVPEKRNQKFTGDVTIVNTENTSDTCTIHVTLKTPANTLSTRLSAFHDFLHHLFKCFPKVFPFLQFFLARG